MFLCCTIHEASGGRLFKQDTLVFTTNKHNNVNMTQTLPQTTSGKNEPNIGRNTESIVTCMKNRNKETHIVFCFQMSMGDLRF